MLGYVETICLSRWGRSISLFEGALALAAVRALLGVGSWRFGPNACFAGFLVLVIAFGFACEAEALVWGSAATARGILGSAVLRLGGLAVEKKILNWWARAGKKTKNVSETDFGRFGGVSGKCGFYGISEYSTI